MNRWTPRARKAVSPASLERSALWHLARRSLTKAQLVALLKKKIATSATPPETVPELLGVIDALVLRLESSLVLDDERVARARLDHGRAAGRSRRALVVRLRRHGIDENTTTRLLADVDDKGGNDDAELQAAVTWAKKKALGEKAEQKALASLARQGFSFSTAKRALALCRDDGTSRS